MIQDEDFVPTISIAPLFGDDKEAKLAVAEQIDKVRWTLDSFINIISEHFASSPIIIKFTTVKPRFTGPLGGKELGPVNREARYIGVHFTLIYTQSLFLGISI